MVKWRTLKPWRTAIFLGGASSLALLGGPAWANPQGGVVVAGSAAISQNGATLTINQSSGRAIVNWQTFSIGAGEKTQINLPTSLSAILNRVTGADPSLIAGQLTSNGQVYLINPNGVVVGPSGQIDTGAFVASTLDVPDSAFLAGGGMTFKGQSGAGIKILGTIKAANGDAVLVAAVVDNQGRIVAPNGQAALGAGGEVFYVPDGQGDLVIRAAPGAGAASVTNGGTIEAASAQLKAAGTAYALAVNSGGLVSATRVNQVGGRIVLDGGEADLDIGGRVESAGGAVEIAGRDIAVTGTVDVSSAAGGGDISVKARGDAALSASSAFLASATDHGDGGGVVISAAGATDYRGAIVARGGAQGGDGGQAEVSGRQVAFAGAVDLTAARGATGHMLLDPLVATICDSCATTPSAIANALAWSHFTVQADERITVDSPITSGSHATLTFNTRDLDINANIALAGELRLVNGGVGGLGGALTSSADAAIDVAGFDIQANYASINLAGTVTTPVLTYTQPDVTATTVSIANEANTIGALNVSNVGGLTGEFSLRTASALIYSGIFDAGAGSIRLVAGGDLTMAPGSTLITGDSLTLASTGGTFVNNAGFGLVAGLGRKRIYAATDIGLNDGGLGYIQYNPVTYGDDPLPGQATATYLAASYLLPGMTIVANDVTRDYGATTPTFDATYFGGSAASLVAPVQFSGGGSDAGTYSITPFGAIAAGYALTFASGTLTVNRVPLTVAVNDQSAVYGSALPTFDASYSGLVNGDTVPAGLRLEAPTAFRLGPSSVRQGPNVGTYGIEVAGTATNYIVTATPGVLTITPAPLAITANNKSSVYGSTAFPTFDATFTGLVNGDGASVVQGLTFATTAAFTPRPGTSTLAGPNAATYSITPQGGSAANYAITVRNPGALTITRAPLVIHPLSTSRTYGSPNVLQAIYSGLVNGDDQTAITGVSLTTSATAASNVGTYAVVSSGGSSSNYVITHGPAGVMTVTRAPLTIRADDKARPANTANPKFTATFTGLINGDTPQNTFGIIPFTYARTNSPAGDYAIGVLTFPYARGGNYEPRTVEGTLRIAGAPPPVVVNTNTNTGPGGGFTNVQLNGTYQQTTPLTLEVIDTPITPTNFDPSVLTSGSTVQINPLLNTPLETYGSVGIEVIQQLLDSIPSNPPLTVNGFANQLSNAATRDAAWGMLVPFLFSRLDAILAKPESQWTSTERDFVNATGSYIQQQRRAAAAKALADFEAWARKTRDERLARIAKAQGVGGVYMSAILASEPPVPPPYFLEQARLGMTMSDDQAARFLKIDEALTGVQRGVQGLQTSAEIAALGFQFGGQGASTQNIASVLGSKFTGKLFPYYSVKAGAGPGVPVSAVGAVGKGLGIGGAVLQVIGTVVQIGVSSSLYDQQAKYLSAFETAINDANRPVTVGDLKAMMSSDGGKMQMTTYMMMQGATGTPDPYANPLPTGTPSAPLDQILAIVKQA